jgi:hypothetical protein
VRLQSGPHRTKLLARLIATGSWHGAKRSDGLTGACIADPFGPVTAVGLAGGNGSDTGIGRRLLGAAIGPGLEVLRRINDAAADLAVRRPRAVGAVFFKGRPDRPRKRAASGVRRKRGGRPASGSGIIALRDLATSRRIAAAGRRPGWRTTFAKGDGEDRRGVFATPREGYSRNRVR